MILTFTVPGEPVAKARARSFRTKSGGVGHFTPAKTRSYEAVVRSLAYEAMGDMPVIEGPVAMRLRAFFQAPKSLKRADKEAAEREALPVVKRPDVDNIAKSLADGMNGVVYRDDCQVYEVTVEKYYSPRPRVEVEIITDGDQA